MPQQRVAFNDDQADKIFRLAQAGYADEYLGRQYGVPEPAIAAARKDALALREEKMRELEDRRARPLRA